MVELDATPDQRPIREGLRRRRGTAEGAAFVQLLLAHPAPGRYWPGSCGPGTPARTTPRTTSTCWSSRWSHYYRGALGRDPCPLGFRRCQPRLRVRVPRVPHSLLAGLCDQREHAREQVLALGEAWTPAANQDGEPREGAWVTELTGLVNIDSWPAGTRLICRRERPHPGAQLHVHRHGRPSLPVLHHRPARPRHRRARGPAPPACRSRGPRQDAQDNRRRTPAVLLLRRERRVV